MLRQNLFKSGPPSTNLTSQSPPCLPFLLLPRLRTPRCLHPSLLTGGIGLTTVPQRVYLEVDAIRSKWAQMLHWCIDWQAHEHPLYALFSSIFSTLSDTTSTPEDNTSPAADRGPLLFSYPQCRLVSKEIDSEDPSLSVIPDFALMFSRISKSSDDVLVLSEDAKMLIEIKRLYDRCEGGFPSHHFIPTKS